MDFQNKPNFDRSIAHDKLDLLRRDDFQDNFRRVVNSTTSRIVLTLTLTHQWVVRYIDFNNAFLYGELYEDVYTVQSLGFE